MFKKMQFVCCIAALFLVACGGDDNNANNANNTNNVNNTNNINNENNVNNSNNVDPQCDVAGAACTVGDPTNPGFTCVNGTCVADTGDQCASVGEACVGGNPTNPGFYCVNDFCEAACDNTECASGSVCIPIADGAPEQFCLRSDCTGVDDTTSCDDGMGNIGNCTAVINNTFLCFPSGTADRNEDCEFGTTDPTLACLPGLQCIGVCVAPCDADNDCDAGAGESCIGESEDFLAQGFGLCGGACTSYSGAAGNCPVGEGCVPLTATEGVCDNGAIGAPIGTVAPYEPCVADSVDPAELCAANTRCIGFQSEDGNIPAVARCLPYCDASAASQQAADATCEGATAFCYNGGDTATPLSGFCFDRCDVAEYGQYACEGTLNQCVPFGEDHVCFPGPDVATASPIGGACDPADVLAGCEEIADCEANGAGAGVCRGRCHPDPNAAGTNPALGCAGGEVCDEQGSAQFNFGTCGVQCTPTNFADTNCPANLQTCIPESATDPSVVCTSSGNVAVGQACGSVFDGSVCAAGAQCANEYSFGVNGPRDGFFDDPGQCYQSCALFDANPGCGAGENCVPHLFLGGTTAGICLQSSGDVAPLQACATGGTACGDAAICTDVEASQAPVCLHFCNRNDANSCPVGQACNAFVGDFGICQ